MSRPIKLRAWTGDKFIYLEIAHGGQGKGGIKLDPGVYGHLEPWQQFTGLTDKNGTEIYEGDIFEGTSKFIDGMTLGKKDVLYRGVVRYGGWGHTSCHSSYGFYMDTPKSEEKLGWETPSLADHEKLEVIGNIHENPELLEEHHG